MFPRPKPKTKDSKNKSKHGSSTAPTTSADVCPENLAFLWSIDTIEPNEGEARQKYLKVGSSKGSNIAKLWFPPTQRAQFKRLTDGKLYRWCMGESTRCEDDERPGARHDVASVFFQPRQDNFVVTQLDCTRYNVAEATSGWGYIKFDHLADGLSAVDFVAERFGLAAPAHNCPWMPQVLPRVYDYETSPYVREYHGPSGGLCGKLSLLIGMAAFSVEEEYAEEIISSSFGFGSWTKHSHKEGIGRYQYRGAVVSIYLDPAAVGVTEKHLKALERGKYGPIWEVDAPSSSSYTTEANPTEISQHNLVATVPRSVGQVLFTSYSLPTTTPSTMYPSGPSNYDSPQPAYEEDEEDIYNAED